MKTSERKQTHKQNIRELPRIISTSRIFFGTGQTGKQCLLVMGVRLWIHYMVVEHRPLCIIVASVHSYPGLHRRFFISYEL